MWASKSNQSPSTWARLRLLVTSGAGLVGFSTAVTYAADTVGKWLTDLYSDIGATLIGFKQSLTGAVARTVAGKLLEIPSFADFGAVGDGVADDEPALTLAFASGHTVFRTRGTHLIGSHLTIPQGVSIIADPGTVIKSDGTADVILTGRHLLENITFDLNGSARQVYGEGADNVTTRRCRFTGSTNHCLLLSLGPRHYLSDCDEFDNAGKYGAYIAGDATDAPYDIEFRSPKAHDCDWSGIVVAGFGERTSPAQTANYARKVRISSPHVYDCGTFDEGAPENNAFSGLDMSCIVGLVITGMDVRDCAEHGAALQEVDTFYVSGLATGNGWAGVCCQSGYPPSVPTRDGIIDVVSTRNQYGTWFKEVCENIRVNGVLIRNTAHSARTSYLASSGLKSNDIVFTGSLLVPTSGSTFTNSNASTNISAGPNTTHYGDAIQPNAMQSASITTAVTIDTKGANFTYPELFIITNNTTLISRTLRGEAQSLTGGYRRRITLMADGDGGVTIRHNQGDGSTYAGFIMSAAANVTLGAFESITFVGIDGEWIEIAKNT